MIFKRLTEWCRKEKISNDKLYINGHVITLDKNWTAEHVSEIIKKETGLDCDFMDGMVTIFDPTKNKEK